MIKKNICVFLFIKTKINQNKYKLVNGRTTSLYRRRVQNRCTPNSRGSYKIMGARYSLLFIEI